jgi:hypothetical protein
MTDQTPESAGGLDVAVGHPENEQATRYADQIRQQWEEHDERHRAASSYARERFESYPSGADDPQLALRLQREGLILAINKLILHPLGLAIGLVIKEGDVDHETATARTAVGLMLAAGDEPIEFDDGAIRRGIAKLQAAGHDDLAALLDDRHIVTYRHSDFIVTHPLAERLAHEMEGCPVHMRIRELGRPAELGRFYVDLVDGEVVLGEPVERPA